MYQADEKRYETMQYNRCGNSGLLLPELSLGLWHNFGTHCDYKNMKALCFTAFDHGITHLTLQTITDRNREVQNAISEEF
mgnify:FL=1